MKNILGKFLINEGMHASNWSSVLVGEGFVLCLEENEDLKGQMDAQDREIQHLKELLQRKDTQFQRAGDLLIIRAELDRVRGDYLRAMNDLEHIQGKNKSLDKENDNLFNDVQALTQELEEQEEVRHY